MGSELQCCEKVETADGLSQRRAYYQKYSKEEIKKKPRKQILSTSEKLVMVEKHSPKKIVKRIEKPKQPQKIKQIPKATKEINTISQLVKKQINNYNSNTTTNSTDENLNISFLKQQSIQQKSKKLQLRSSLFEIQIQSPTKPKKTVTFSTGAFEEEGELKKVSNLGQSQNSIQFMQNKQHSNVINSIYIKLRRFIKKYGDNSKQLIDLYCKLGYQFYMVGEYKQSIVEYEKAKRLQEKYHGVMTKQFSRLLHNIGVNHKHLKNTGEAKIYLNYAANLSLKLLGYDNLQAARTFFDIGQVLEQEGDMEVALYNYEKSLVIYRLKHKQAEVVEILDITCQINHKLGCYENSVTNNKQIISIYQKLHGFQMFQIANPLFRIGLSSSELKRYDQAFQAFDRCFNLVEKNYKHFHTRYDKWRKQYISIVQRLIRSDSVTRKQMGLAIKVTEKYIRNYVNLPLMKQRLRVVPR